MEEEKLIDRILEVESKRNKRQFLDETLQLLMRLRFISKKRDLKQRKYVSKILLLQSRIKAMKELKDTHFLIKHVPFDPEKERGEQQRSSLRAPKMKIEINGIDPASEETRPFEEEEPYVSRENSGAPCFDNKGTICSSISRADEVTKKTGAVLEGRDTHFKKS